jgi:RNA polymerase sigma factor (sigma-70 family)
MMASPPDARITRLLAEWSAGSQVALNELMPLVYDELRRLAQRHLRRERPDQTLQRTALVHEAFLRLVDQKHVQLQNRTHFFQLASQLMRRILVDHARRRLAAKRRAGSQGTRPDGLASILDFGHLTELGSLMVEHDAGAIADQHSADLVAIEEALTRLAQVDSRQSTLVELRFFGGLSIEETAQVLGISDATVKRDWALARAWLRRELANGETR